MRVPAIVLLLTLSACGNVGNIFILDLLLMASSPCQGCLKDTALDPRTCTDPRTWTVTNPVSADVKAYDDGDTAFANNDYEAAVRLWRPLADQGDVQAQFNLGFMYYEGYGLTQDYVQAHKWFSLAHYTQLDAIAAKMTPSQIAEAQKLAREWKPTPAR